MVRGTDRPSMTIAVDLGRKATKQNKQKIPDAMSYDKDIYHTQDRSRHAAIPQHFSLPLPYLLIYSSVWYNKQDKI